MSVNSQDTSISRSKQLEAAIPPSKIPALSSGEFVGMVADDPDNKIELKTFPAEMVNDHEAMKKEQEAYKEIPIIRKLDDAMVQRTYLRIKQDVQDIQQEASQRCLVDTSLETLPLLSADKHTAIHFFRFWIVSKRRAIPGFFPTYLLHLKGETKFEMQYMRAKTFMSLTY